MLTRNDLVPWIVEALKDCGGRGSIIAVSRHVWENHEAELKGGDMLYKWQYEIRWAAKTLRERKVLKPATHSPKGVRELR